MAPNGLELSCPAEAGNSPILYGTPAGETSTPEGPARRVSFSELLGARALGSSWRLQAELSDDFIPGVEQRREMMLARYQIDLRGHGGVDARECE
jgi:hypothetical protein